MGEGTAGPATPNRDRAVLALRMRATYGVPTVINSVTIAVTAAVLLLIAIVTLTMRRLRAHDDKFELGTVSQQWLLGHKADDR